MLAQCRGSRGTARGVGDSLIPPGVSIEPSRSNGRHVSPEPQHRMAAGAAAPVSATSGASTATRSGGCWRDGCARPHWSWVCVARGRHGRQIDRLPTSPRRAAAPTATSPVTLSFRRLHVLTRPALYGDGRATKSTSISRWGTSGLDAAAAVRDFDRQHGDYYGRRHEPNYPGHRAGALAGRPTRRRASGAGPSRPRRLQAMIEPRAIDRAGGRGKSRGKTGRPASNGGPGPKSGTS